MLIQVDVIYSWSNVLMKTSYLHVFPPLNVYTQNNYIKFITGKPLWGHSLEYLTSSFWSWKIEGSLRNYHKQRQMEWKRKCNVDFPARSLNRQRKQMVVKLVKSDQWRHISQWPFNRQALGWLSDGYKRNLIRTQQLVSVGK